MQSNAETLQESTPELKMNSVFRVAIWVIAFMVLISTAYFVGKLVGKYAVLNSPQAVTSFANLNAELEQQRQQFVQLKANTQAKINGMAARLASLQAGATRMNALGQRLVDQGKLDSQEFDFTQDVPVGGPEMASMLGSSMSVLNLNIDNFAESLKNQQLKLQSLESLLMGRELDLVTTPKGWPVRKGWISSRYGKRTDPFSGKPAHHAGIDFVGKRGSEVLAVADGVIVWAANRSGYGKAVDIDHGNGYVTRYAHNDDLAVQVGETVRSGQVIAKLGSTGRASAPHVHFEVHKDGKNVNPWKFIR